MGCFLGMHREVPLCEYKTLAQKTAQLLGTENVKDLAEKSSASYDLSPAAYKCFASFSYCNKLRLIDTLQEFMEAGGVLNFIKLIKITLKTSLCRL